MCRSSWLAAVLVAAVFTATLPAQDTGKTAVLIFVTVPADGKLTVNGNATSQTGPERRLITPPLALGEKGTYKLSLTFTKDGKPVTVEREIVVEGGKVTRVDLTKVDLPKKDEPKTVPIPPKKDVPKVDEPKTVPVPPKKDEPKVTPKVDEPKTVPVPPKKDEPKVVPKKDEPPPPPKKDTPPKKDVKLDVPYVPTPQVMVDKMLEVAGVKEGDVVFDLGSGDGRIVITAVQKHKAKRGVGIEIAPERVQMAKDNAEKAGVAGKTEFRQGDFLKQKDFSEANVVTLQLLPDINEKLKPILRKTLKPGSRVVSYDFDMGEDWKPEKEVTVKDKDGRDHVVYLWTIKEAKKEPKGDSIPGVPLKELPKTVVPKKDVPPPFDREPKATPKKDEKKDDKKDDAPRNPPYVPTPQTVVDEMLKFAGVKEGDVVYDLGCGDGRIVVTAVKSFKAKRAVGIDIDPVRVKESKQNAKEAKVEDKVEIREGDVLKIKDVSEANVVALYLFPEVNEALAPMLKKTLKPGSRIVSHDFLIGDWKPEKQIDVKDAGGELHTLFLWTIK
ncbi:MAG TPA: methyltransferase domain-containing protein [Gemmataceae bacterium]|nr:methyltransferase domain-containing protein [Gemmataceae bacterium]